MMSCQVRFNSICSLRESTLPKTLNRLGAHYWGQILWALRKSLVILPMGSLIPPSMKAIIGMTTSPSLRWVSHSPEGQYCKEMSWGMWYKALNLSIPMGESTKWVNLSRLVEKTGRGENSLRTNKLTRIWTRVTAEASRKLEDLGSLKSLEI